MSSLLTLLLSLVVTYGYPIVIGVVILGEFGLPIPVSSILLAAGSLTVTGTFNIYYLLAIVITTVVLGDIAGYFVGRYIGKNMRKPHLVKAAKYLTHWGGWGVFFTRWLITPLGVPINLMAGIRKFPFRSFVWNVILGESLWATIYLYLGYLFGINWQALSNYLGNVPYILTFLVIAYAITHHLFHPASARPKHR